MVHRAGSKHASSYYNNMHVQYITVQLYIEREYSYDLIIMHAGMHRDGDAHVL